MAHRAQHLTTTGLKRLGRLLCVFICASMLNGCAYLWRDPPPAAGRMPPPPKAAAQTPESDDAAMSADASGMDGAMGMKAEPLFAEKIFSKSKRLDRVENVVQSMHDNVKTMHEGTTAEIAQMRNEISTLKSDIETLREEQAAMMAPPQDMLPDENALSQDDAMGGPQSLSGDIPGNENAAPQNAIKAESKRPTPPPAAGDKFTVSNIRFGEHPNKTRIVLDIDGKPDFTVSLDNVEKILLIELPGGAWTAPAEGAPKSPLISSYSAQAMGKGNAGNMLVISLKHVTEIVAKDVLAPTSGGSYRIVIDLFSNPVHS